MRRGLFVALIAGTVMGACLGSALHAQAELRRRQHAQFCFPETDWVDDYYIWGHVASIDDGRINNQSDLINHRPRDLWCPVVDDSQMPHHEIDRLLVHGTDDDTAREVSAQVCLSRFTSALDTTCSSTVGSGVSSTGDFELDLDVSILADTSPPWQHAYPFLIVTLPDGQTPTRVTGYTLCMDDSSGSC